MLKSPISIIEKSLVTRNLELRTLFLPFLIALAACGDFMEPVESTPEPTAYGFNYWLLNQTYLYEDELKNLPPEGDSVPLLYSSLSDKYTRYYPPSKSEAAENQMNTSIVEGDLGMEYLVLYDENNPNSYPILVSRVYDDSPAGRARIPRYSRLISANGIDLVGMNAKTVYDSIVDHSAEISLVVFDNDSLYHYDLVKETVFAPTVFLDTISGIIFITITEFRASTADRKDGTAGELRTYLDSTTGVSDPRVIDLRNNPGGLIGQCLPAADLFVKEGLMSRRNSVTFAPDGSRITQRNDYNAKPGDPGENGKFLMLANRASASCAEVFIAAVQEQGKVPLVGTPTFGKGIGQSQWKTPEGGLAVITSLEFWTPKGNSYNKKGINPDIPCEDGASRDCAIAALKNLYGWEPSAKTEAKASIKFYDIVPRTGLGGAVDTVMNFVDYPYSP